MPTARDNLEAFALTLQQNDIRFQNITDDSRSVIRVGYNLDNLDSLDTFFFFDDNGETLHLGTSVIAHVPQGREAEARAALNELNITYRWMCFYLDRDNDVMASSDLILSPNTVGDTCFELLHRAINIVDEAYPAIMKAIWA